MVTYRSGPIDSRGHASRGTGREYERVGAWEGKREYGRECTTRNMREGVQEGESKHTRERGREDSTGARVYHTSGVAVYLRHNIAL